MRIDHAVTVHYLWHSQTLRGAHNRATLRYSVPRLLLKGGVYPIKNRMLKIYTEFAGLGDFIFNIEHRAGFSGEKIHLCVLCDQYTEMPPF